MAVIERHQRLSGCKLSTPVSRLTGEVRSSTHLDGYGVNQDLWRLVGNCCVVKILIEVI